jgi:hypothetical protein
MFFWRLHDGNIKDKIKTSQTPKKWETTLTKIDIIAVQMLKKPH